MSHYFEENNLRNHNHYGWNIDYTRTKLFADLRFTRWSICRCFYKVFK
ncbi:MAG: hypothetical protein ACNI3H_02460 [Halarcobacter ebronensis]